MIVEGPGNFVYLGYENGLKEAAHVYIVCVFGLTFCNVFMETEYISGLHSICIGN